MGLLLSILVVCVGVIEVLSCYEHFQYGVLHCATNVYERARRRSSVFLKYTSRRLRLLAEESVEEEPELLRPREPTPHEPTPPERTPPPKSRRPLRGPPKPPTPAPPAPTPPARLGKEDKIKIVKTLLEKPRRPKTVRSVSMPEPIFAQRDELTDIIDSLAVDTIEEVNIEVEEDAELLTNEFEKLFEEYDNDDSTPKRSETAERMERKVGMLENSEKPNEKSKVDPPVVVPPKEPPKSAVGGLVDVKVQSLRPSRPCRSVSLDCNKSVYADLVSSYFAKTKSVAASPKKSKSRARRIDKLDDVTVKSDTPPVELIDETFEEIYKDVCVDVDDVTDFEEIEKSILEEEDEGVAPKNKEPPPISNAVLLKAAQQLAEIIVRNLLKEIPKLNLGKPTDFALMEIPPERKKPGTDGRSAEDEDMGKQAKMVLEEEGNGLTDAEDKEVEEEIQKITSTMSQIGVPMEIHKRRDTPNERKPEDGKTDDKEADIDTEKDEATEKDKLQDREMIQSAGPTAFGDVEEEIQKLTSTMNQTDVPMTRDRNDGRDTQNAIQKDKGKKEDGKVDGVKPDTALEKQTPSEATEKDKRETQKERKGKDGRVGDTEAVAGTQRHEVTEKDERDEIQPGDPANFGDSVAEEIPKTITTITHLGLPMEEHSSEGKDTQKGSKLEVGNVVDEEADNVVAAEKDKQQDWDKLLSEGPADAVEEIRKILSPIIKATVQMGADISDEKNIQKPGSKQDGRIGGTEADGSIGKPVVGEAAEKDRPQDREKVQSGDSVAEEIPKIISTTGVPQELQSSNGENISVKEDTMHAKLSQEGVVFEKDKQDQNKAQSGEPTAFGNPAKTEIISPIKGATNSSEEFDTCNAEKDKICSKTLVATTYTQPVIDSDRILLEDVSNLQDMQQQARQSVPTVGASMDEEHKDTSPVSGATCPELLQNETGHPATVGGDTEKAESRKEERNEDSTTSEKARTVEGNTAGSSTQLQEERQIKDILKKIGIPTEIADGDFVEVEIILEGDQFSAKPQDRDTAFVDSVNREDNLEAGDKQNTSVKQQYSEEVSAGGDSAEAEIKKIIKASKIGVESVGKHTQKDENKQDRRNDGSNAVEQQIEGEVTGKDGGNKDGVGLEGPTGFRDSVEEEIRKTIATIGHQTAGLEQDERETKNIVELVKEDAAKQSQERGVLQKVKQQNQSVDPTSFGDAVEEVISTSLEAQEFQIGDEFGGATGDSKHDTKGEKIPSKERTILQQQNIKPQELENKSENGAVGKLSGETTPPVGVHQVQKTSKGIEEGTASVKPHPGEDIKNLQKSEPTPGEETEGGTDNKNQQRVMEVSKSDEKVEPRQEESPNSGTGPPRSNKPGPGVEQSKRPKNITDSNNDVRGAKSAPEAFWLIFSGEYTKAMSKDWHSGHFSCWQCDEALTGQRYVLRDDHPYCIKCYESVFANVCEECNKIIGIDSKDLSYKDKHWHEACFLCNKCRVSLVDKQFGSKADKIYCGNCYDAQFASRCDGCGEIFRAGTKKMEYKTRQWHEKCFCCCVCKTPIGTKSFIPREQEIYCATCYEEKFATRCVKCNKIITSGGVTYKNEPWHRECFTCTNCNTSLAGQRFTSRDEKPYCADCFGELFAKRCTACSRPITGIGGTRFISFEDRHWHNDCFICASCKTSLVGRGFITDGDDIICPECAKQKLM